MTRTDASPLPLAAVASAFLSLGLFLVAGGGSDRQIGSVVRADAGPASAGSHPQPVVAQQVAFEPIDGRSGRGRRFLSRGAGYDLEAASTGWRVALHANGASALNTRLIGASRTHSGRGLRRLAGKVNILRGDDPSDWRTGLPTFGSVRYREVYRGVDLVYHGRRGALEYDFRVAAGADARAISLGLRGARSLSLAANGDLVARLAGGTVRQRRPIAYQYADGERRSVAARFILRGKRLGFRLGRYDHHRPLVIDPSLVFADYIGGTGNDAAQRVAIDGSGNIYVTGISSSASIPGAPVVRTKSSANDMFVMKLSPSGTREWISYVGGSSDDGGNDIALDGSGRIYVVGFTDSTNFPTTIYSDPGGTGAAARDAFLARLKADGTLDYATYYGYSATNDNSVGLAVEPTGQVYITVTKVASDNSSLGEVVRFDSAGVFDWSIGSGATGAVTADTMTGIAVAPNCQSNCDIFFTGQSWCCNPTFNTAIEAVVFRYHTSASTYDPVWGWYFSTSAVPPDNQHPEPTGGESPTALAVDSHGNPAIIGTKYVSGPHNYAFAARFANGDGALDPINLTWQSPGILNGDGNGYDITFDGQDNIILVGALLATNDDATDGIQTSAGGSTDGQIVKYFPAGYPGQDHTGAHIVWGTYLGGSAHDFAYGVAADGNGNVFVTGETNSPAFIANPLTQPMSTTPDGFVLKVRTNTASIDSGPSGTVQTRDVTFGYTAGETGGSFQCRLIGPGSSPGFTPCGVKSQAFTGLADGDYTFELKAYDSAGTTNGEVASRTFTVDLAPHARFSIAPNPALAGRSVTFDGSASSSGAAISRYEWDLDGNGSFETDNGGVATVAQIYPSAGTINIGLRITDAAGKSGSTSNELRISSSTTATPFGVTINDGAQYTNDPDVVISSTFPSFTNSLLISNDGGFGKAQTFPAKKATKWKLDSSGPERLPKIVYVRFLTGSVPSETHTDDIILDETPPKVSSAVVAPAAPAASGAVSIAKLRKFKVRVKARDNLSGVSKLQVTANKKKPGKALKYRKRFTVKSAKRPRWVRARDKAGNWSKWRKAK